VLFVMGLASGLERWATFAPERVDLRTWSSVAHYILQPLVLYLELAIIMPPAGKSNRVWQTLLALPAITNTAIYLAAPFVGGLVFCYDEHYWFCRGPLGVSVYVVTFLYLGLLLLWSARLYQSDRRRTAIILLFMAAIAILTGVLEATNLVTGFIDETFALGALLYYIHLITVHESQMQTELAEKDLELTRNKVQLLREQIRPHFVFNSLQVIKSLIRTDQDRAVLCLEDFSDYLQANLDAMASDKLVPFDTELQHVEAYVSLALADQTKPIRVEYDIQERYFSVPPLTIEPIVENAIRHGVSEGGTVTLSTYATEDGVAVVVSDDGKGIDGSGATGERAGVGLTNVRTRLDTLCDGTLEFESGDTGTTVTVRIPQGGSSKGGRT